MKAVAILVLALLFGVGMWLVIHFAPLFLNSKIERLHENNLPKIIAEKGGTIYCRMKADDFRFPLPPGSRATNLTIKTGGFDTVDGSVEVRFEGTNEMTTTDYQLWLRGKVQKGGQVTAHVIRGGLLVNFHYFGDR